MARCLALAFTPSPLRHSFGCLDLRGDLLLLRFHPEEFAHCPTLALGYSLKMILFIVHGVSLASLSDRLQSILKG